MKKLILILSIISVNEAHACGSIYNGPYYPFIPVVSVNGQELNKPELLKDAEFLDRFGTYAALCSGSLMTNKKNVLVIAEDDLNKGCYQDAVSQALKSVVEPLSPKIELDTSLSWY